MSPALPPSAVTFATPRALWAVAALYVLAWSLLPPLLSTAFPLDVVESLTWGHEAQWGYYKHPPLAPWVLYGFYRVFGSAGPFLLSQLCILGTLWLVWLTGCRLMSRERALIGAALTMAVVFHTRPALEFNHNVAQIPLWAGIGWALLAALQDGRLRQWLLLGALVGLGLLTKYSVLILLACLGAYVLLGPQRRVLLGAGPWLALLLALLVVAPHAHWFWQSGGQPLVYASGRAEAPSGHPSRHGLSFLVTQALNHLPLLLIALISVWPLWRRGRPAPAEGAGGCRLHTGWPAYLLVLALAPGLLTALLGLALGVRVRDMWGVPMWTASGLLLAACLPSHWLPAVAPRLWRGLVVWLVLISLLSGTYLAFVGHWRQRPLRTDWPQAALAAQAQAGWAAVSRCPLDVVAGNYHLAGVIAVALAPQQPSVLIDGDPAYSPWITQARLQQGGALWLGLSDQAEPVSQPLLGALAEQPGLRLYHGEWRVDWPRSTSGQPFHLHWRAYVPAACVRNGAE